MYVISGTFLKNFFLKTALRMEKIIANEATDKGLISKNIQAALAAQFQKNK